MRPRPPGADAPAALPGGTRRRPPRPPAILVASCTLLGTCALGATCLPSLDPVGRIDPTTLPEDALACLRLADDWSQPGTSRERKLDALVALDRAEDLQSDVYITDVIRARTYFRLFEENEGDPAVDDWAAHGVAAARAAVAADPDRVEGHYYLAALLGRQAERSTVGAMDMIPEILAEAQRSADIDKTYDHCGPLVALGELYIAAPPWPQSVGDPDTGLDYLRQAVQCSDYPVNAIMLADALVDQGQFEEARGLLRGALSRPPAGDWAVSGNHWRPIARDLLDRAEHPGAERH